MKASFSIPFVESNNSNSCWGPPPVVSTVLQDDAPRISTTTDTATTATTASAVTSDGIGKFVALPYAPFGRSDRLGRAADFINPNQQHHYHNQYRSGNNNNAGLVIMV